MPAATEPWLPTCGYRPALNKISLTFLLFLLSPLLGVYAVLILALTGQVRPAAALAYVGLPLLMFAWLFYVTARHSKRRWPDSPWHTRLGFLLTLHD